MIKPALAVGALIGGIILACTLMSKSPVAIRIAKEQAVSDAQYAAQIAVSRAEAKARDEAVEADRLSMVALKAKIKAFAKAGYDAGYKVGLDIVDSLGSNRTITVRELGIMGGARQKQYADAGASTWDEGFGSGLGQALIDKDVTIIVDGSGYSRGGVFYLDK